MVTKARYEIDLTELRPVGPLEAEVRNVRPDDRAGLAQLMLDGYRRAVLFITFGNRPSESLFASLGAAAVPGR